MKSRFDYSGTPLCESYVHISPFSIKPSHREQLDILREKVRWLARESFKTEFEVYSHYEEGSLKYWIAVAGSLYTSIVFYGEFRKGIDYVYHDSKVVAEWVGNSMRKVLAPTESQRYRIENRTGALGLLKSGIDQIDSLKNDLDNCSPTEVQNRLSRIIKVLQRAVVMSHDTRDQQYIIRETIRLLNDSFPEPPSEPDAKLLPVYAWRKRLEYLIEEREGHFSQRISRRLFLE